MPFGPNIIQPAAKLNYRNQIEAVDNAAADIRNFEIAAMNREYRLAQDERRREQNE